ncbi:MULTISPECIES: polysaccharide deacetylase family protein [unclassified Streptomyces]|uniref:polysaccharide deacetylase family protein n=1 Tax=unclassified Streptomyces TaxID=2593676 RepID=UPI000DBA837F|nr:MULTISPECIES: polysaccharide deacetylase family protein [unclassified Streptomyces]MYT69181.1 polysaccharide deacetylase family protein [Streptomyces sp. SID8367]RAJ82696.1 polysaccharide deacetylase [Streptomyces sp. PsTaAH-137]
MSTSSRTRLPSFDAQEQALRSGQYLRVVNYHNTPHADTDKIRGELSELAEHFSAVTLDDLDLFRSTGRWHKNRPGVIPVFYEGYRNNAEVAAPLAEEAGLTAWFFICTAFLDVPVADQYDYANAHDIDLVQENEKGERLAMTWDDVAALSRRHVVTPHTANHAEAASLHTDLDLQREIFEPKRRMDAVTGQDAASTAFLWGTPYGANPAVDAALREAGYRYQFGNTMIQYIG